MKFILSYFFVFLFISVLLPQGKGKVYLADIDGEIDLGIAPYISRVISEAELNNASAIIFRINTFGGRVDAATKIKDAILSSKILTIAYINNRAVSAGALIALSCNKIVMVPGSLIGAATVVDQTGQKVGEKYQSYMRSEMRSTAERNGRRTDIAQGMVDERIIVEGLDDDSTKLISLTAEAAFKFNISDAEVSSIKEVKAAFGLTGRTVSISSNWAEDVVKFLNNPIVSTILILAGIFGIMAEVKTPGWGVPGTAGLIALALFFGSSYILQLASVLDILLFVAGIILLAVEIFIIPGFGVTGISGIILIIVSLFFSLINTDLPFWDVGMISTAIIQIAIALVLSIVLIFILAKYLPKNSAFRKFVLEDEEKAEDGFVSYPTVKELIGAIGTALTTLRPAGTAEFDGQRVDVVADWEYIERGAKIKVLKVEGIKVVVKEIKEPEQFENNLRI